MARVPLTGDVYEQRSKWNGYLTATNVSWRHRWRGGGYWATEPQKLRSLPGTDLSECLLTNMTGYLNQL